MSSLTEKIIRSMVIIIPVAILLSASPGCSLVDSSSDIPTVDEAVPATRKPPSPKKDPDLTVKDKTSSKTTASIAEKNDAAATGSQKTAPHEWVIVRHTVGKIKIGDTKEDIYAQYPSDQLKYLPPSGQNRKTGAIELLKDEETAVIAEFDNGKTPSVWRIKVLDPRFKTSEGIHVGSRLAEIKKAHSDLEFMASNKVGFVIVRSMLMSFVLDASQLSPAWLKDPKPSAVPPEIKVTEILVL